MDSLEIQNKNDKVFIAVGVVGVILVVLFYLFVYSQNQYTKTDDITKPIVKSHEKTSAFDTLALSAEAAVVWDVRNKKIIYQKNASEVLPLASLTKLMTALAGTELLPQYSTIRIAEEYLKDGNDSQLFVNENWQTGDLISHTLITSSNAGANAIASAASAFLIKKPTIDANELFLQYMNERADKIGLTATKFYNDSGLDLDLEKGGAYGNAKDMATLTDYILSNHPDLLEPTTHSKLKITTVDNIEHNIKNTDTIVDFVPGILGSKTGFTDLAGGNLIVTFSPGLEGPYVAVVLGSTFDGRFTDTSQLVAATLKSLEQ